MLRSPVSSTSSLLGPRQPPMRCWYTTLSTTKLASAVSCVRGAAFGQLLDLCEACIGLAVNFRLAAFELTLSRLREWYDRMQHGKTSTLKTKWHTSRSIQVARCGHANLEVSGMQ